ncbi:MAG: DUF3604 domain-containing protein [Sulfurovum sp.]|nr:DUF3604 domain-containing protein [Sulfurovum sp.]
MYNQLRGSLSIIATLALVAGVQVQAADSKGSPIGITPNMSDTAGMNTKNYSPFAGKHFPTRVFWGDTHVHTKNSLDARGFGVTLGPEEAFRLARGEEVVSSNGEKVKLRLPLDWLVVADHSDGMGAMDEVFAGNPELLKDPTVRGWYNAFAKGGDAAGKTTVEVINSFSQGKIPKVLTDPDFIQTVWDRYIKTAEQFNDPGHFTAIIGYEWTSTENGNNLHRNVLYRDGGNLARQMLPYTAAESFNPEELWKWMQRYEDKTSGKVLALAHNGNMSNGMMFPVEVNPDSGKPLTGDYMKNRARWEPLYEVTQIKGDGETHPVLSPNDEFADFETLAIGNLNLTVLKTEEMLKTEYARKALKDGLKLEEKFGTNPYKFGMVGSSDAHTALAAMGEDNYFGKHAGTEPSKDRIDHPMAEFSGHRYEGWAMSASGYAAVWATDNTREALFDAMKRKEVYATTGPRMLVRFFGGWDFTKEDGLNRLPAEIGYSKGVPMGGDLYTAPDGKVPSFLVAAMKDPYSGNLDRIQVIKGWLDAKGETHEKVYDVAWSNAKERKPDAKGKLPAVGNTVDVPNATWTNTIGAPELITVWKDPDFDPKLKAFYYARVIEIPTPRWTAYDAKHYGLKVGSEVPMIIKERAYTSPIWYTPTTN